MNYEVNAAESAEVEITTDREAAFALGNAVFAAFYDGREDADFGKALRADLQPTDAMTEMTFRLSDRRASRLADYLDEARRIAESDGRDATARRLDRHAYALRVAVAFRR